MNLRLDQSKIRCPDLSAIQRLANQRLTSDIELKNAVMVDIYMWELAYVYRYKLL